MGCHNIDSVVSNSSILKREIMVEKEKSSYLISSGKVAPWALRPSASEVVSRHNPPRPTLLLLLPPLPTISHHLNYYPLSSNLWHSRLYLLVPYLLSFVFLLAIRSYSLDGTAEHQTTYNLPPSRNPLHTCRPNSADLPLTPSSSSPSPRLNPRLVYEWRNWCRRLLNPNSPTR